MLLQSLLQQALQNLYISYQSRVADQEMRARKVDIFRRYYDGDHVANLSPEMRKLLRAKRPGIEFTDNYCRRIVNARSDRAIVKTIEGDDPTITAWAEQVMLANRLDSLQTDVHEGAFRDADSFLMVGYDNARGLPTFTHEPAYDGRGGMIAVYRSEHDPRMDFAAKIWTVASANGATVDNVRVNVYYPDRIEKYVGVMGATLQPYSDPDDPARQWPIPWTDAAGEPLGIPVFHFRNQGRNNYGLSVLEDAVPLQDAINRTLVSLVLATEMTAFQILVALGFDPPAAVSPGMFIVAGKEGILPGQTVDVKALPAGDVGQILAALARLKQEIHDVTNTPLPDGVSAEASGEARKQHEVYLLGEIRRFQVKAGEAWERAMEMAHKLAVLYGMEGTPTEAEHFRCTWASAEVRNQQEEIASAISLRELVGDKEVLRLIAHIYNWDETHIALITQEKAAEAQARIKAALATSGFADDGDPSGGADDTEDEGKPFGKAGKKSIGKE